MTVIYVSCCWFIGIWLATKVELPMSAWLTGATFGLAGAIALRRQCRPVLATLCLAALCGGGARLLLAPPQQPGAGDVALYNGEKNLTLSGVVSGEPALSDNALSVHLQAESVSLNGERRPTTGLVLVRLPRFAAVDYGDRLLLTGTLETPPADGLFDYRAYLARRGIYSQMALPTLERVEAGRVPSFHRVLFAFKGRLQVTIDRLFPGQEAALLSGILLGNDNGIAPSLQEAFRRTGTTHIIAISGFNIALLVGMLLALAHPFLGKRRAAWVALIGVALYTLLVGADAAVVRAAIMGSLYVGAGRLLGRPTFVPATLFTAGLFMTATNPLLLWDVGFQLSFAATLGLMLYVPPLSRRARTWVSSVDALSRENGERLLLVLVEAVAVTVAAQLATLPLLLYHFGHLSLISLPANLLILPAQPGVMVAGGMATLVGLVAPLPSVPIAWIAGLFLRYTIGVVRILANAPLAAIGVGVGPIGTLTLYLLLLALAWLLHQEEGRRPALVPAVSQQTRRALPALSVLGLILAWQAVQSQPDGYLHVAFLDVGQGDAIFIQSPSGRQVLVDGGHYPSRLKDRLGQLLPFWDRHLDLIVATHPDADHVSGLPDLFQRYRVDLLITGPAEEEEEDDSAYAALLESARTRHVESRPVQAGERIVLDEGVYLECVHPGPVLLGSSNEDSIALRLVYGDFALLLSGDAGEGGERAMVTGGYSVQAQVLKAGHHGARTSSNDFFLAAVQPRVVIVSAGAENRFGHPHPEMLARVANTGATILRTDQLGTIQLTTDGRQLWWQALRR